MSRNWRIRSLRLRRNLRFIGLKVPRKFLEQAFINNYGFDIHEVLGRARPALRSYRTSVRTFIPSFAEAEVVLHGSKFPAPPEEDETYRKFIEQVARTNYERKWSHPYGGPGFKAPPAGRSLCFSFLRLVGRRIWR